MPSGFIIAIDGPVASGKGVLAKKLAQKLNGFYLYTGAMYRSIALLCIDKKIDLENEEEVESVLPSLDIHLTNEKVFLNGKDVTDRLKEADTASGASVVGVFPEVREKAVALQQKIGGEAVKRGEIVVSEGRDTGTLVFPDAAIKIFLTARPEIRAKRRMEQYLNSEKDLKKQLSELLIRDKRDMHRDTSPLSSKPEHLGYFVLDNSNLTEEQTIDVILGALKDKKLI